MFLRENEGGSSRIFLATLRAFVLGCNGLWQLGFLSKGQSASATLASY